MGIDDQPYGYPCHSSTSASKSESLNYMKSKVQKDESNVLFSIHFPNGFDPSNNCLSTCISEYSQYPSEQEYLIDPQELFTVKNVSNDTKYVTIDLEHCLHVEVQISGDTKKIDGIEWFT